jgi:hypothetical protein
MPDFASIVAMAPSVEVFRTQSLDDKLACIYAAQKATMTYVLELEKKAEAMGSPEGMAKMMESFTGNMFGGMKF